MKGLITKVKAGREIYENGQWSGKTQDLTIDSLKKPIDYIREKGLEKDFGRTKVYMNINAYINPDFCILYCVSCS